MSKKLAALLIIILVFLALIVIWLLTKVQNSNPTPSSSLSPYSAVYLSTGDIYFGELSWFPKPRLKDAWFIQRGVDAENQAALSVVPMDSVFWGPIGEINLNPDTIIFSARLRSDSQIIQLLNSRGSNPIPVNQSP